MKKLVKVLVVTLVVTTALSFFGLVQAMEWQDSTAIKEMFVKAGVQGTFVMYDVSEDKYIGYDRQRAETRFIPASTFKIPNSLIGLSVGAVKSVDEVFPYDGKPMWMKAWEKDMDLREAFRLSCYPIYQQVARRVGLKRMQDAVTKLGYGNSDIGTVVDNFWLEGPLKISAVEQTQFLKRLAQGTLPFPEKAQAQVRDIAQFDHGDNWTLYAKTGWTGPDTNLGNELRKGIGWLVGWVKKGDKFYTFALNIDLPALQDASKRIDLGRASLKELGVIN